MADGTAQTDDAGADVSGSGDEDARSTERAAEHIRSCIIRLAVPSAILLCRFLSGLSVSALSSSVRICRHPPRAARPLERSTTATPAQQLLKISRAGFALRLRDRGFRSAAVVSQIHQRGNDIRFDSRGEDAAGRSVSTATASICPSTHHHSLCGFAAHGWNSRKPSQIAPTNCRHELLDAHPLRIFSASVGPRRKPKAASQKMFSRDETNPYSARASSRTWCGSGGHSVCSSPSAAYLESALVRGIRRAHVDEHLVRLFRRAVAKLANHRSPVFAASFAVNAQSNVSAVFANEFGWATM